MLTDDSTAVRLQQWFCSSCTTVIFQQLTTLATDSKGVVPAPDFKSILETMGVAQLSKENLVKFLSI